MQYIDPIWGPMIWLPQYRDKLGVLRCGNNLGTLTIDYVQIGQARLLPYHAACPNRLPERAPTRQRSHNNSVRQNLIS